MDISDRTVPVGSCTSPHEAELMRHVLAEAGIESAVASDDAGGLHPELAFSRCATYRLLVPETRFVEARGLLDDFELEYANPAPDGADPSGDAQLTLGSRAMAVLAALLLALVVLAWLSNNVDMFTGT